MGELEKFVDQMAAAIEQQVDLPDFHPGKVSMWIKLVKFVDMDGAKVEQAVGTTHKLLVQVGSYRELVQAVAEHMALVVFGSEVQIVQQMPNLIVKLFDRKAYVSMTGAPPVDQAGQIYLKATVYEFKPSLWDQLFHRKPDPLQEEA